MRKLALPRQAYHGQVRGVQRRVADEKNPTECGNPCGREGGRRKSVSDETQPSRDSTVQALAQLTLTLTCPSSCRQRDARGDRPRPYDCPRAAHSSKPPHPLLYPRRAAFFLQLSRSTMMRIAATHKKKHGFRHSPVRLPSAKLKEICSSLRPPGSAALSETRVCSSSARHRGRVLRRPDRIGCPCSAPQRRHAAPGISFWRALWTEREADRGEHAELSGHEHPLKKIDS